MSHRKRYPYPERTYYVDYTNGLDTNRGNSEDAPFKTLSKLNTVLKPRSRGLLKRGETWAEQLAPTINGRPGMYITYGAYGSGVLPIINGSAVNCALYIEDDYHHLRFENIDFKGSTGIYSTAYVYDANNLYFYNCTFRDAAARHGASVNSSVHVSHHITFENCMFQDNYKSGILADTLTSYEIYLNYCTAYHNGTAYGDHGFYIGGGVTADHCLSYDNYDAGFKENDNEVESFQYPIVKNSTAYGNKTGLVATHKNATFYNNLVYSNTETNMSVWGNTWGGYKIYFNTFVNSTNASTRGISYTLGTSSSSIVHNNIFVQDLAVVTKGIFETDISMANLETAYDFDYNVYYTNGTASSILFGYDSTDTTEQRQSWNDWHSGGRDTNGTFLTALPGFVTRYTDLHPADAGNLKGLGLAIAGYAQDKSGKSRADPPTPGCYDTASD